MADTLITQLNDSFVDFDVLGTVDPVTFAVTGTSHFSVMVRVIFREFYPRGLTALDKLDEGTLGTRPSMSHVTAR